MGAHWSEASEGASGFAVPGVRKGVVFDLIVPRLHQLEDGSIAVNKRHIEQEAQHWPPQGSWSTRTGALLVFQPTGHLVTTHLFQVMGSEFGLPVCYSLSLGQLAEEELSLCDLALTS